MSGFDVTGVVDDLDVIKNRKGMWAGTVVIGAMVRHICRNIFILFIVTDTTQEFQDIHVFRVK